MIHWGWLLGSIILTAFVFSTISYMFGYRDGLEHGKMGRHDIQ